MNIKNLLRKIGGFAAAALLLAGIVVFSNTTAEAQRRYRRPIVIYRPYRIYRPFRSFYYPFGYDYGWYNRYSQYVFDNSEDAQKQGYKDGVKTGKDDGKKKKSFNFERSHYYHDSGFGNFAEVYRENFSRGYEDGYREGQELALRK